jgi:osmotically inducible protein OsmC
MTTSLYETTVTAHGGRAGHAESTDGRLAVSLSVPQALGGAGGPGTNPEQLFAAGYAACYDSALRLVARKQRLDLSADAAVTARVSLVRSETSPYQLAVKLTARLPGVPEATARGLMETAHQVCPYSDATRGNVTVTLALEGDDNGHAASEGAAGDSAAA